MISIDTRERAAPAILVGAFIGGTLDIAYAAAQTILLGGTPVRMLKSIAAGLLGRGALSSGAGVAVLGLLLHFVIALGAATTYYLVSRRMRLLVTHAWICGLVFGAGVYLFMNRVVLPLSALRARPALTLTGLFPVMVFVGLAVALSVRRYAGGPASGGRAESGQGGSRTT